MYAHMSSHILNTRVAEPPYYNPYSQTGLVIVRRVIGGVDG